MIGPDFDYLCGAVKERSGIVLTPEKAYLVDNRLAPIARRIGYEGVPALLATLRSKREETLLREVTDALTQGGNESWLSFGIRNRSTHSGSDVTANPGPVRQQALFKNLVPGHVRAQERWQ